MATKPILARLDLSIASLARFFRPAILADYWALTKPEVNFLILITTFAGFYLAREAGWRDFPFWLSINALLGTLLVASGTGTLNQYIERRFDAQMRRTARRPLAAGRLKPAAVLWFGRIVGSRQPLSRGRGQYSCEPAHDGHVIGLSLLLHSPQTKDATVHSGWRISRRDASSNRLGRGVRQAGLPSMDPLRNPFSLAVPALHGDRVDVPRRLRPHRLPGTPS